MVANSQPNVQLITMKFCELVELDEPRLEARRRRPAQPRQRLPRPRFGCGDRFWRSCAKEAGQGAKLMALFGCPQAQENDAERGRAPRARHPTRAFRPQQWKRRQRRTELSARVGLESGPVAVEPSGEVFGDALNTAARVQSVAGPGSILITAAVQRQTTGLFVAEDRRQEDIKGVSTPKTLYRVVRANGGGRRNRRSATRVNLCSRTGSTSSAPGVMSREIKPWTAHCMKGSSPSYRARTISRSLP